MLNKFRIVERIATNVALETGHVRYHDLTFIHPAQVRHIRFAIATDVALLALVFA